ncbi:hypothetical protein CC85DRAFT_327541 [Cutaneotrichosporon oleaginosum]|uniref:Uncharacterized protein n=1 Tax=Cutaneotrichosporon oleaginosum TaxID=879819 RepID=A0A0J0XQ28_9TREE|nr:uncharacterized protein CC85DRAFT_327541 [Cutaneotrichosporon oleaginosum]KLT43220.1 hypothetical protein CC85DRAFT_327541 [Cutaneotrichosporon oleaginosum]TXT09902.1 hypothetical protein COLE_03836 [Cutaneotrichosporon oleaginosum]
MCPPTTVIITAPQLGLACTQLMLRHPRHHAVPYSTLYDVAASHFVPGAFEMHLLSEWTARCDLYTPCSAPLDPGMDHDAWVAVLEKLVRGDALVVWYPRWSGRWPGAWEVWRVRIAGRVARLPLAERGMRVGAWIGALLFALWVWVVRLTPRGYEPVRDVETGEK